MIVQFCLSVSLNPSSTNYYNKIHQKSLFYSNASINPPKHIHAPPIPSNLQTTCSTKSPKHPHNLPPLNKQVKTSLKRKEAKEMRKKKYRENECASYGYESEQEMIYSRSISINKR